RLWETVRDAGVDLRCPHQFRERRRLARQLVIHSNGCDTYGRVQLIMGEGLCEGGACGLVLRDVYIGVDASVNRADTQGDHLAETFIEYTQSRCLEKCVGCYRVRRKRQ